MTCFVEIKDLRKVYRSGKVEVQALRGLSMRVERGEMVCITGPSGSGKTTLLSIIGGLIPATSGVVMVNGVEVTALPPSRLAEYRLKRVGHIFQSLNLIPFLSAEENVALPMIEAGVPPSERRRRVEELLHAFGLEDRRKHRPSEMSGGEQQRVAIACALANDPPLLLADEPTGELDTETSRQVVEYLVRVNKEQGKTIILVTHDPAVARAGDRIQRITDGRITGEFEPASLKEGGRHQEIVASYLRQRLEDIQTQLNQLDRKMKRRSIAGEEYARRRRHLRTASQILKEELHRLGMA